MCWVIAVSLLRHTCTVHSHSMSRSSTDNGSLIVNTCSPLNHGVQEYLASLALR
jgi:hypothetical protein